MALSSLEGNLPVEQGEQKPFQAEELSEWVHKLMEKEESENIVDYLVHQMGYEDFSFEKIKDKIGEAPYEIAAKIVVLSENLKSAFTSKYESFKRSIPKIFGKGEEIFIQELIKNMESDTQREELTERFRGWFNSREIDEQEMGEKAHSMYAAHQWDGFKAKGAILGCYGGLVAIQYGSLEKAVDALKEHLPTINAETVGIAAASFILYEKVGPELVEMGLFRTGLLQRIDMERRKKDLQEFLHSERL